ncbi:ABC transporter substrate-binding protein [Marinovum sp. 2_MG-2023]|uniref:ABC transporter substrate-binding protein n=1 Tax=unclassified Marinovum TaxID=2647166 RepID=UPI0026E4359F|nr:MULTISPECIES: ABC transporter substrate-binding protein [unclassified Marinovum]MDO6732271.1 ABC transporter substrate-binding protein [Marinovum sp. 2_MG-2023]MDO6781588.1 ABC transporter substrate-binding protein [Marinovum sp. 1_MG-2023]
MHSVSRRRFLAQVSAGATVIGLSHLLDPSKAFADTPDAISKILANQTPQTGGKLVYGQTYPNWALGQSNRGTHPYYWLDLLTRSVWNALTWVDEDFNVQLELAASLVANDKMDTWDATLREGVMFHDGTEMTADDVVASMNLHMGGGVGLLRANVAKTEKLGKYALRFHLVQPNAEFPYALAEYRAVIMKANADVDQIGYDGIGTGPFKLVEIDNARQFRAVRNENYWGEQGPFLDELQGVITHANAAINGFRAGQLNAVWNIDPGQIEQFEDAGAQIHRSAAGDQFYLNLPKNLDFPWNDQNVRKAMSLAIDRTKINEIVYGDASGWTGNDSHMSGVNAEFVARPVERDVAQARALLAEAGYSDGVKLPAIAFCPNFPEEPRIYPIVAESLAEVGIEIVFEERPCDGFSPYVDAVNAPYGRPHRNLVGPRNPFINLSRADYTREENTDWTGPGADEYSRLVNTAVGVQDEQERLKMYQDAQRILQEEVPGIMLGGRRNMVAHAPNVMNARSHSQNWSSRFEYIWIDSKSS